VRLAEDRSKPAAAVVGRNVAVANGVAKVTFTLSGVACPGQLGAVASLSGAVKGKAAVKVCGGQVDRALDSRQRVERPGAVRDRPEDERPADDADRHREREGEVATRLRCGAGVPRTAEAVRRGG
jgi:hypothetical protein